MLDIQTIKAISLDLDDTLWPVWPAIEGAEKALENWLGHHAPMSTALFANPLARHDLREYVMRTRPDLHHQLSKIRLEAIRLALERSGENVDLAPAAFDVFFAARNCVQLFDDALPALQLLAQHYPLVALTNGNADIETIGLGSYFCANISAQKFGVGKPDPRIFHAAAGAANVLPHQILHVGDDALLDVLGALNSGMQAVWLNRGEAAWSHALQPHETVTTLTELCGLLQI